MSYRTYNWMVENFFPWKGPKPPPAPEFPEPTAAETELTEAQAEMARLQVEQAKTVNEYIEKELKQREQYDAWQADPSTAPEWFQEELAWQAKEKELIGLQLDAALGRVEVTPEREAEITAQWDALEAEAQTNIERRYSDLVSTIQSGRTEDLAAIQGEYEDLMYKFERDIPEAMKATWRGVSPLMRQSATAAGAMGRLGVEITRMTEDIERGRTEAMAGVQRRATTGLTGAAREKAFAGEQLGKEVARGKLGAQEAARYGRYEELAYVPPYYATGLQQQQETARLGRYVGPYQQGAGLITTAGEMARLGAGQQFEQRYTPWAARLGYQAKTYGSYATASAQRFGAVLGFAGQVLGGAAKGGAYGLMSKCLPKGTLIETENGRIPIEDLKIGDRVIGGEVMVIQYTKTKPDHKFYNHITANGTVVASLGHPMITKVSQITDSEIKSKSTYDILTDSGWYMVNGVKVGSTIGG